jgi:hypothetical protein
MSFCFKEENLVYVHPKNTFLHILQILSVYCYYIRICSKSCSIFLPKFTLIMIHINMAGLNTLSKLTVLFHSFTLQNKTGVKTFQTHSLCYIQNATCHYTLHMGGRTFSIFNPSVPTFICSINLSFITWYMPVYTGLWELNLLSPQGSTPFKWLCVVTEVLIKVGMCTYVYVCTQTHSRSFI